MSLAGNATDSGGECTKATSTLFPLPGEPPQPPARLLLPLLHPSRLLACLPSAAPASSAAPYYFWSSGPVFLVVLSTEHDFTTGSPQLKWLAATLKGVNRTQTPFLVISAHRPM